MWRERNWQTSGETNRRKWPIRVEDILKNMAQNTEIKNAPGRKERLYREWMKDHLDESKKKYEDLRNENFRIIRELGSQFS